jgi:hypothetical protein
LAGENEELLNSFVSKVDASNSAIVENHLLHQSVEATAEAILPEVVVEEEVESQEEVAEEEITKEVQVEETLVELDDEAVFRIAETVTTTEKFQTLFEDLSQRLSAALNSIEKMEEELRDLRSISVSQYKKFEQSLTKLSKSDEEKRTEWLNDMPASPRQTLSVSYRPREVEQSVESKKTLEELANETMQSLM